MKIEILGNYIAFKNEKKAVDELFQQIDDTLKHSSNYFSHLMIDGEVVYEDPYNYIMDKLDEIKEISVCVKTLKEFIEEVLFSTMEYLKGAVPQVEILSNEFYKEPQESSWRKLIDLFEGMRAVQW